MHSRFKLNLETLAFSKIEKTLTARLRLGAYSLQLPYNRETVEMSRSKKLMNIRTYYPPKVAMCLRIVLTGNS